MTSHLTSGSPEAVQSSLAAYRAAVNGVAGIVTALGLLGLWGSTYIPDGAVKKGVESVAAAILAIGVLQVLSEAYLQRRLSGELFDELGAIERRLAERNEEIAQRLEAKIDPIDEQMRRGFDAVEQRLVTRIDARVDGVERLFNLDRGLAPSGAEAVERSGTDWGAFVSAAREVDVVPTNLTAWLVDQWPAILETARTRPLKITVHLVNVNGSAPIALALATRTGQESDRLREDFGEVVTTLKQAWRAELVHQQSRLLIHTCDAVPGFGVMFTETAWAVLLPGANGPTMGTRPLVSLFRNGTDPGFLAWARSQPGLLQSRFFDEVQP